MNSRSEQILRNFIDTNDINAAMNGLLYLSVADIKELISDTSLPVHLKIACELLLSDTSNKFDIFRHFERRIKENVIQKDLDVDNVIKIEFVDRPRVLE